MNGKTPQTVENLGKREWSESLWSIDSHKDSHFMNNMG
jgi:hypothetical protein